MDHHRAPDKTDRTKKWMLYVARRRANRRAWRAAKVTLVAMRREGVGPGVKMLDQRSSINEPIISDYARLRLVAGNGWRLGVTESGSGVGELWNDVDVGNWNPLLLLSFSSFPVDG